MKCCACTGVVEIKINTHGSIGVLNCEVNTLLGPHVTFVDCDLEEMLWLLMINCSIKLMSPILIYELSLMGGYLYGSSTYKRCRRFVELLIWESFVLK